MRIEAISHSLPSQSVSNEEILDLIKFHSKYTFSGNLNKTLRKLNILLKKTGAEHRYWLDKQKNERPIDHLKIAVDKALKKANLSKNDIDLMLFVGIGKGFLEPAQSYMAARALGMDKVRCFDITDACMSWMAALQIADSFFKSQSYKRIMIVNTEFTVQEGVFFKNYALEHEEQIEYTLPTYTIGEAATCTILSPDDADNFSFKFTSRNDLSDLCVVPLPEYKGYCDMTPRIGTNGPMKFTSYGAIMHDEGEKEITDLYKSLPDVKDDVEIVFTHGSSKNVWHHYGELVGISDKMYHIYHKTGNLISASVPTAVSMALDEGVLKKDMKTLFWVGSAGMSFSGTIFDL